MSKPLHLGVWLVEWIDAHGDAENWTDKTDLDKKPRIIKTVGFLMEYKEGHVSIAQSVDEKTKCVTYVLHIPEVNIVKKELLLKP